LQFELKENYNRNKSRIIMKTGAFFLFLLTQLMLISCGTEPTPTYDLTTSVIGNGVINPSSGQYDAGESVTISSTPDSGWVFSKWDGDITSNVSPETFTMDSDKSIIAIFERKDYPLTITIEGEGTVTETIISQSKATDYPYETIVELTANPSDGWNFIEWSGDISGSTNTVQITINSNKNVTASFAKIYLNQNGVTIMCPNAQVGEKGFVDGVEYEVVDRDLLNQKRDAGLDLTKVCVSLVTDMSDLFSESSFNQDIGNWDVSSVKSMSGMFYKSSFNQDIGNWDVSNVTSMYNMFSRTPFNQDIGGWDVSNVLDMGRMFWTWPSDPSVFNQDLGDWNVGNVVSMRGMFTNSGFNQDIGDWDVSSVVDMNSIFSNTPFNQDIGNWNVSNVTTMSGMFSRTPFNQDIGDWDVSNVIEMSSMFSSTPFNQDIASWQVGNVTKMNSMFSITPFNQNIGGWDVSSVTNMSSMFASSSFNQDIGSWDVSNVTNMRAMFFRNTHFIQNIGGWDVGNVSDMSSMFAESSFNQNLSGWCVNLIQNEPENFSNEAPLEESNKPKWGTCPSN